MAKFKISRRSNLSKKLGFVVVNKDIDTGLAREKLRRKFGNNIRSIRFGEIRADGTRGVTLITQYGTKFSYSYLTDIVVE